MFLLHQAAKYVALTSILAVYGVMYNLVFLLLCAAEKDMLLIGILSSTPINCGPQTVGKPFCQKERKHRKTNYIVESKVMCRETFKFLHL